MNVELIFSRATVARNFSAVHASSRNSTPPVNRLTNAVIWPLTSHIGELDR
jgi:hypothetical protein